MFSLETPQGHSAPWCKCGRSHIISRKLLQLLSWNFTNIYMGQVHLSGMIIFPQAGVSGVQCPLVLIWDPLYLVFVRWLLCVKLFLFFHSYIPLPRLLSWVKVKCRRKLCEGQSLCHNALWCCLDISGTMREWKLKLYTQFDGPSTLFSYENLTSFSPQFSKLCPQLCNPFQVDEFQPRSSPACWIDSNWLN